MNERIQKLANQCMVEVKNVPCKGIDGWTSLETVRQVDPEKFAELIVRECIDVVEGDDGDSHVRQLLLQHFGDEK